MAECVRRPDFYREMYRNLPPGSIVMIAVPDTSHEALILEALEAGFHVVSVKSLCTSYEGTLADPGSCTGKGALRRHRFSQCWDYRTLIAREQWGQGFFGVPRAAGPP